MIQPMKNLDQLFRFKRRDIILTIIFVSFIIWNAVIFAFLTQDRNRQNDQSAQSEQIPEIAAIRDTPDKKQQEKHYIHLIERIGPEKAQDALLQSGLPPDGDAHLLNHTVGDWLYKKYGTEGLTHCKDYFLSSCYHGFVILAIADAGTEALNHIMTKCQEEGSNTATQCAHAIGHGMLAFEGYKKLPQALIDCDNISETSNNFPTYNCYDGVFMENIQAVHDDGRPSPDRWLKKGDLIYPCNAPEIPEKYIQACWSNQSAWLYEELSGDFKKMGKVCLTLENSIYQETCFDSLARMIHPASRGDTELLFTYCHDMPSDYWDKQCQISIVRSAFSIGEKELPFTICKRFPKNENASCYESLLWAIAGYTESTAEKAKLCNKISDATWRTSCQQTDTAY